MGLFHGPNKLQTEIILKFKTPEQLVLLLGHCRVATSYHLVEKKWTDN